MVFIDGLITQDLEKKCWVSLDKAEKMWNRWYVVITLYDAYLLCKVIVNSKKKYPFVFNLSTNLFYSLSSVKQLCCLTTASLFFNFLSLPIFSLSLPIFYLSLCLFLNLTNTAFSKPRPNHNQKTTPHLNKTPYDLTVNNLTALLDKFGDWKKSFINKKRVTKTKMSMHIHI